MSFIKGWAEGEKSSPDGGVYNFSFGNSNRLLRSRSESLALVCLMSFETASISALMAASCCDSLDGSGAGDRHTSPAGQVWETAVDTQRERSVTNSIKPAGIRLERPTLPLRFDAVSLPSMSHDGVIIK